MDTALELGERSIIETILKQLDRPKRVPVPFGDDVAALDIGEGDVVVLKTDMLVGKTDMPPDMSYWQAARKAIIMNISDLAAKGVKPLGLLAALGIPPTLTKADLIKIGKGLNAGAREFDAYVLGGDTSQAQDLIISVAAFGFGRREALVLRNGAQAGDIVATTGQFGLAPSGLRVLMERLSAPRKIRKKLVDAVLMPKARLKEGLALSETGVATASIDSSDGMAWSLHEIGRASKVGFIIDYLPIAREALEFGRMHNLNPLDLSLYGGEEYELIVTIKRSHWNRAEEAVARTGGKLIRIGETISEQSMFLKQDKETTKIEARGYEHFRH